MINLIKKHYGIIKAKAKKENNIVAYNNYNLLKEISSFLQLNNDDWTKKNLLCFAKKFYQTDNKGDFDIISNIVVGNFKRDIFFQVAGCLEKSSAKNSDYLHVLKLNNFSQIKNLDVRKAEFLLTYFHENEHIQQCKILRNAYMKESQLNYCDKIIISEFLAKNVGFYYSHLLSEIKANYVALKRYKALIDNGIMLPSLNNIYCFMKNIYKLFENVNMGYFVKKELNPDLSLESLVNVDSLAEHIYSQNEIFSDVITNTKEFSLKQKKILIKNLANVDLDKDLLKSEISEVSEFCISVCKEYNEKLIKMYFKNPQLLFSYVNYNNIKNSIVCIPELLKQNRFNAIEFAQKNIRFIETEIHKQNNIENINLNSIEYQ